MKLQLPSEISSKQDLQSLILEVRQYGKWFQHVGVQKRVGSKTTQESPQLSKAAADLIRELSGKKGLTISDIEGLRSALEDYLKKAPTMTVTLAAPAGSDIKRTVVEWARKNIAPDVLVNFQFNSTLLGGMVVRYGSHIFDWSFRRQILDGRNKFAEVLRHV